MLFRNRAELDQTARAILAIILASGAAGAVIIHHTLLIHDFSSLACVAALSFSRVLKRQVGLPQYRQ